MPHLLTTIRTLLAALAVAGVAVSAAGEGTRSAFTAADVNAGNYIATEALQPPADVAGTLLSDGRTVRLTWTPTVTTEATGYRIYRAASAAGPYTLVDTVAGATATTTDQSPPDGTWRYVVRAFGTGWESPDSAVAGPFATATLDHFAISAIGEQSSGRSFSVTITARTASNQVVTGWRQTATLSTSTGTITPATTGAFSGGTRTETVTITGSYSAAQTITVTGGSPAKTGTSTPFVLHDWVFAFKKTTPASATGCKGGGLRFRDMSEGYAGLDPEETYYRVGDALADFCSPAVTAPITLPAGTTTVRAWIGNGAGSACTISTSIYKGTTLIGGPITLTINPSATSERIFSIPTPAIPLAVGDRLGVWMDWGNVKACNSTSLHYGGTTMRSRVHFTG